MGRNSGVFSMIYKKKSAYKTILAPGHTLKTAVKTRQNGQHTRVFALTKKTATKYQGKLHVFWEVQDGGLLGTEEAERNSPTF